MYFRMSKSSSGPQTSSTLMDISRVEDFCNTLKYTLAVFDMFRVFCKPNLIVS